MESPDDNFFYDPNDLVRAQFHGEMPRDLFFFVAMRGLDTRRRNNLLYLEEHMLLTAAGNTTQLLDPYALQKTYLFGYSGGGIGAIAVHPRKTFFAVGEKGIKPHICIYTYPDVKLYRVLRNGTERGYSSLRFSEDGMKLASVGAAPDFLLTVWNWMGEQMILRCKAFGQEVFNVQFAPNDNGFLTTSGTGHIRFWKMASTFTGLKLQGDIGKFGKSELSDIEAFCVLPDKKVLSSTERGALLLWDGNFIKCEIVQGNRQRAHNGPINVIKYEPETKQIVTAGADGTIKWWHFQDIDQADVKEDETVALVEPKEVAHIITKSLHHTTTPADIRGLVRGLDHYLIQDGHGLIHRYDTETKLVTELMECHAGSISGVGTSPCEHVCATCGIDGAVTCWDYTTGASLYTSRFNTGATALAYAPKMHDVQGKTVAIAFQDGVIRILERGPTTWHRVHVFKPHNQPITCMAYSPDGRYFVSASQDNTAFIFQCPSLGKYEPVGFKTFASGQAIRHLSWRMDSKAILFTCLNGLVGEVELPSIYDEERTTYELDTELKTFTFRRTRKLTSSELSQMLSEPSTDKLTSYNLAPNPTGAVLGFGEVEVAPDSPALIQAAVYCCMSSSCFLVSVGGAHTGQLYKCLWGKTFPMDTLPDDPTGLIQSFTRSYSGNFLLCGNANGKVQIRASLSPFAFLNLELHDQASAGTSATALAFDDSFLVSGGSDGQLVVTRLQAQKILTTAENMTERNATKITEAKKVYQTAHDQLAAKNDVRQQGDGSEPTANLFMHNPIFAGALAYMQFIDGVSVTEAEELQGAVQLIEKAAEGTFGSVLSVDLSTEPQVNHKEAPDITNREAYTIQDAKLKLEADIRANSALAKKNRTRAIIAEMQDEFRRLQVLDSTHEPMARLEEHLWNIDPEYGTMLLANGDKQCEEVRKEMAYLFEQSELLLGKMRRKYVGNLAVELITLHGFQNGLYVQSFRTLRMSDELQDRLRLIHLDLQEAQKNQKARDDMRTVLDFVHKPKSDNQPDDGDRSKHSSTRSVEEVAQSTNEGAGPSSHRFEYRKLMRVQRKARIQAWESKKPREDADDPRDVAAIFFANTHMEDFKLKTSANYVVPEEQRVNAMKKRKQMALLEEKMYDITMNFNAKVLELRELKHRLVEQIQEDINLLESLEKKLKTEPFNPETKWALPNMTPLLDLNEWPEQRERVLDSHIEEYQKKGTITSAHMTTLEAVHHTGNRETIVVHPLLESKSMEQSTHYALSQLEEEENHIDMIKIKRQIELLKHKIVHAIQAFDEAIYRLRREKMKLDIALKKAEIKLMTRLGELVLLEQFESKENLLVSKLEKCKADKAQVVQELTECYDQLILKRKELEDWQTNEGAIQTDFINLVGQLHPSFALIQKIFKKRLKRIKKRNTDDMDEEEEEESEEEYNSDDDDDDNDSNEEEICPSGCDMALYEKVLALREKKADIDDAMSEITKSIDELKRSNDRQIQKQRQIDKELTVTEQDIQTFQTEKQMRFNELDVVVALSKLQLRCLETRQTPGLFILSYFLIHFIDGNADYLLPETVESSLIFNNSVIQRLSGRILSLQDENKALRQVFKDLHKQQSQLLRDKSRQNEVIAAVRDKCEQLQLLKFGQLIDIDVLDKACDTGNLNELKAKVRAKEIHNEKQCAQSKTEQQRLKLEILQATEDNTRLLTEIATLSERHFTLESELNQADVNNTLTDDSVQLEREMSERKKLVELVKLQSREIEALKQEVLMLRGRKGRVHATMQ
ncbi:phytophthora infestans avirulence-associated protein 3.4F-A [Thraustotheca clavata]|uniref:Phytophthora infestans avirulence-associated protein 3.4F-A n=1 Tax=Thraustotheca clavata TaxID=74557 RepID=A0A1W0A4F3_9STRA|nr:phytophthora infestans avirulence-associated protein 3.4F-A [Thraustotheca clavata]